MQSRLRFQKGDIIAVALVIVLAAAVFACFLPGINKEAAYAEIYQNGKLVRTLSLAENQQFTLTGDYSNTISVKDGKVAVTESDCPGGDCINCGWAHSAGRSIVCLPNALEIRIVAEDSDVDFVVR